MGTQVVRGPKPGTLLDQGTMHRVVVRVAYQLDGDNNNISDSSVSSWHRAYCRYTLQVMPPSGKRKTFKRASDSPKMLSLHYAIPQKKEKKKC